MRTATRSLMVLWGIALLGGSIGCDSLGKVKPDNPVMGPPPPRHMSATPSPHSAPPVHQAGAEAQQHEIVPISLEELDDELDDRLFESRVVAKVNGFPIFASEVLERYGLQLRKVRQQMPPREFHRLRLNLIRRDLPSHIDRKLLVESLRATLNPDQFKMVGEQLDRMFDLEVERMKRDFGVNTRHEIDLQLEQQGTSLASLRDAFANQRLAAEYLQAKSNVRREIDRHDLIEYYRTHLEEKYTVPRKVKWQQILISQRRHGSREKALDVMTRVVQELRNGAEFGEIARTYSDGPTANEDGVWDWMQDGSLSNQKVEEVLFSMPVGQISPIIESDTDYQLVKVLDRKEAGRVPFEDVQDEIQHLLEQRIHQDSTEQVLKELYESAIVETIFDDLNEHFSSGTRAENQQDEPADSPFPLR